MTEKQGTLMAEELEKTPSLDEWSRLYEAAIRIKDLAPWEWMEEVDVFDVQDPERDTLGFVSVMGLLGEHYAAAVYLGPRALYDFWSMQEEGDTIPPERILEIPQLQASFEDRQRLEKGDLEIIKAFGLKLRGRQAWPLFRSFRPGYLPWYLEADEARFLTHVLEQTANVAPRFRDEPSLLDITEDAQYLVRAPRREDGSLVWEDRRVRVPPPAPQTIEISFDGRLLQAFKRLPRRVDSVEVDLFMLPHAVRDEPGSRPYFPYHLLIVEAASGLILTTDLLKPEPSLEAMWGTVPQKLLEGLAAAGFAPRKCKCAAGCSNSYCSPSPARRVFPSPRCALCAPSMRQRGNCSSSWAGVETRKRGAGDDTVKAPRVPRTHPAWYTKRALRCADAHTLFPEIDSLTSSPYN